MQTGIDWQMEIGCYLKEYPLEQTTSPLQIWCNRRKSVQIGGK